MACHRGHLLSGYNLMIAPSGHRSCRACRNARKRTRYAKSQGRPVGTARPFCPRLSEPGQILARGPLDYDVPVLRRCVDCHGLFAEPLNGDGGCPHCQRTLDLGGAA